MLTNTLAIYAAIVSTITLVIAYFAYRSEDPKLSGRAKIGGKIDPGVGPGRFHTVLSIFLSNRGRGAITVDAAEVWCARYSSTSPLLVLDAEDFKFPLRIEGHSGVRWEIPFDNRSWKSLVSENEKFEVLIGLATGATLTLGAYNAIGAIIEEASQSQESFSVTTFSTVSRALLWRVRRHGGRAPGAPRPEGQPHKKFTGTQ